MGPFTPSPSSDVMVGGAASNGCRRHCHLAGPAGTSGGARGSSLDVQEFQDSASHRDPLGSCHHCPAACSLSEALWSTCDMAPTSQL